MDHDGHRKRLAGVGARVGFRNGRACATSHGRFVRAVPDCRGELTRNWPRMNADIHGLESENGIWGAAQVTSFKLVSISYPRQSAFICGCLLFLILVQPTSAQHGGKAEPNRIEFKHGATSTTVSGVVRGDEEAEYVLSAKKGQRLIVKLSSMPAKSSVFQLLGEDNDTLGLEYDANFNVSLVTPKTGDYFINVKRPTEAKGTSRYRLTVTIR